MKPFDLLSNKNVRVTIRETIAKLFPSYSLTFVKKYVIIFEHDRIMLVFAYPNLIKLVR